MRINKDLVEERAALVQTLRDYAVGKMADHDAALAASRDLRTNVMTEVCVLHYVVHQVLFTFYRPCCSCILIPTGGHAGSALATNEILWYLCRAAPCGACTSMSSGRCCRRGSMRAWTVSVLSSTIAHSTALPQRRQQPVTTSSMWRCPQCPDACVQTHKSQTLNSIDLQLRSSRRSWTLRP
jgi:hypothetical protein